MMTRTEERREIEEAEIRLSGVAVCPYCHRETNVFERLYVPPVGKLAFRTHSHPNTPDAYCEGAGTLVFPR